MTSRRDAVSNKVPGYADVQSVAAWREALRDPRPAVAIMISSLQCSDSPRLGGENVDHTRTLAESENSFPPIIVNRSTMRVIDGMHRLRAAMLRGRDRIAVQFFEGDERDAFILAVEANIKHGLPLSLADRTAAAARIISSHPQLSDRVIAASTGLAARTVGGIRRRSTADNPQLNTRVGRDGRIRPLNATEGRMVAAELMAHNPNASLREIASAAGISSGTAHNVRERLRRGNAPVPLKRHESERQKSPAKPEDVPRRRGNRMLGRTSEEDRSMILKKLHRDPSLRFTSAGRTLIRLLNALAVGANEWEQLIHDLPPHCAPTVTDAALACAQIWQELADRLGFDCAATTGRSPSEE
jgi:ParB-like chromosome segregation protein Spo0J